MIETNPVRVVERVDPLEMFREGPWILEAVLARVDSPRHLLRYRVRSARMDGERSKGVPTLEKALCRAGRLSTSES